MADKIQTWVPGNLLEVKVEKPCNAASAFYSLESWAESELLEFDCPDVQVPEGDIVFLLEAYIGQPDDIIRFLWGEKIFYGYRRDYQKKVA